MPETDQEALDEAVRRYIALVKASTHPGGTIPMHVATLICIAYHRIASEHEEVERGTGGVG